MKQLEAKGDIKQREKDILAGLERDLRAVQKAREQTGQSSGPSDRTRGQGRRDGERESGSGGGSILGKRNYNGDRKQDWQHRRENDSGDETDESVRRIPMPEDTPPPVPREHRRYFNKPQEQQQEQKPVQTTYSAAPQIRDLKKEAVNKFVPNVVRRKQDAVTGKGGLIEPDEMDRLEAEGYYKPKAEVKNGEDAIDEDARRLAEEEARFEKEMAKVDVNREAGGADKMATRTRNVEIEGVEDEDV